MNAEDELSEVLNEEKGNASPLEIDAKPDELQARVKNFNREIDEMLAQASKLRKDLSKAQMIAVFMLGLLLGYLLAMGIVTSGR